MDKKGKTTVAFMPRGNKVLVRVDFKVSELIITKDINKIQKDFKPVGMEVVAIAENVQNLAIGDQVVANQSAQPQTMHFNWNKNSLVQVRHRHSTGQALVGVGMVDFSEYLLYDEYDIVGIILKED